MHNASDRHALLLAAGQARGIFVGLLPDTDLGQQRPRLGLALGLAAFAHHALGQAEVLGARSCAEQVEMLEHHADFAAVGIDVGPRSARSTPSMLTEPSSNSSRPFRQRRKVDLPEPDGPITTSTSPLATRVLTSSTARTTWPRVSKTFSRLRTSITLSEPPLQSGCHVRKGQVQQQVQRGDAEPDLEGGERGGDRLAAALWSVR